MARMIDGDDLIKSLKNHRLHILMEDEDNSAAVFDDIIDWIEYAPTLTPPNEWISVNERLPKLPNTDYCSVMVIAAYNGDPISRPMSYERVLIRGRRVERWEYYWDRIADETPDYWMPLPEPPGKEREE